MSGSVARNLAIALLLIEGFSGATAGLTLVGGMMAAGAGGAGAAIGGGILGYGFALLAGALGLLGGRDWGWITSVVVVLAGLAVLAVLMVQTGGDAALLGGIAIWGATLAVLLLGRRAAPGR